MMDAKLTRTLTSIALAAMTAVVLTPPSAGAEVHREGEWPEDKAVSLEADGITRAEAIQELAEAAGWSLVGQDLGTQPVHMNVRDQAPFKVLEMLLSDADYVATRDGSLISIAKRSAPEEASAAPPPAPAAPSAPEAAKPAKTAARTRDANERSGGRPEDCMVTESRHIGPDEVVHDLAVFGGEVTVEGLVTGDVFLLGGNGRFLEGSHVVRDIAAIGSTVEIDEDARVDGEVHVVGGTLRRGDEVVRGTSLPESADDGKEPTLEERAGTVVTEAITGVLTAIVNTAFLWVFGAILLALAGRRMEVLQTEVARRPWRTMGYGLASIASGLLIFVALCVTLIGIPIAVLALFAGMLATHVGFLAVVLTAGTALARHRTENPYKHLAVGCAVYLVVGFLPGIGDLLSFMMVLIGAGAIVVTRGAGLIPERSRPALSA